MRHAGQPDKFLEVLGNELRTVVRDDPGPGSRKLLLGPPEDDFNIRFQHPLPDLPVRYETAAAIQNAAEVVKRAADVQIRDIYVPMLMRQKAAGQSRFPFCSVYCSIYPKALLLKERARCLQGTIWEQN